MKRTRLLVAAAVAASFGTFGLTLACDCLYRGPFLIAAYDAPVIVQGRVVAHFEHGLDLEIHDVYRGEESRSVVRIWGDNGRMCRMYASQFPDGSEWVVALHRTPEDERFRLAVESTTDYQVSVCGEYAVQIVDGDAITFDELGRARQVELPEFEQRIRAWGNLP